MAKKNRQNKTEIKRQIAQFLATNQPVISVQQEPPIKESNVVVSDVWSQTTLAEVKRISIVFIILLVILIGLTIADRKGSLIEKFGNAIANVLQI